MYFAGRDGLSNVNLGEGGQLRREVVQFNPIPPSPSTAVVSPDASPSLAASKQRGSKRAKLDLAQGVQDLGQSMENMGAHLATAFANLVPPAPIIPSRIEQTLERISETLEGLQQQQKQSVEEQTAINLSILKQLAALNNKNQSE
jgi:hypothetical protein